MKFIPISQETVIPNFTTISARVWNEIVTKIIMNQHVVATTTMYPFQNLKLC